MDGESPDMRANETRARPMAAVAVDGGSTGIQRKYHGGEVVLCGHRIRIESEAGVATNIVVALDGSKKRCIAFDMGAARPWVRRAAHVFITHCHLDHMSSCFAHARTRRMMDPKAFTNIYVPAESAEAFRAAWRAFAALDSGDKSILNSTSDEAYFGIVIHPIRAGDEVNIDASFFVSAWPTRHRVPSLGYCVQRQRKRLAPELQGKSRDEILEWKRSGRDVNVFERETEIVYTGDTEISAIDEAEALALSTKILIMEATFLSGDDTTPAMAAEKGHIHIADIAQRAQRFDDVEAILLMHHSQRYAPQTVPSLIAEALPKGLLDKIYFLSKASQGDESENG